ncbi:MAG: hypothetical protein JJE45_00125 [Prolixibacteraceae bacterium]|nr:hypothetical protein [Prolixibacteraceae bacterium]
MNPSFHPKEYAQMRFDPTRVPKGTDILKFYKDLGKIKEFRLNPGESLDNNKVIQYVLCMYDMNSPYRKKYSDVLKRKIEVAHDCEFPIQEGGIFESVVEDFLKGKNRVVNQKIVQYAILHRSYKYAYQISVEAAYFNLMLAIQAGDTKSITKLGELRDELESNLMELLNEDNNPHLKDEMLRYLEDERLALRPEDYAKKAQEGKEK